jgi:hypothetical protein
MDTRNAQPPLSVYRACIWPPSPPLAKRPLSRRLDPPPAEAKATPMLPQSHTKAPPKPPRGQCRMQNVERRKPPKARYKPGTCEVQARYKPGASQVQARYMRGTCVVHVWYKPPQSHPEAKRAGGEPPWSGFASVGISVAAPQLVPVPPEVSSTASHFFPAKSRTHWNASLASEFAPRSGAVGPLQRHHRAAVSD